MNKDTILKQVQQLIADHFGIIVDSVDANKSLDDFNLDSLDIVEITMAVEDFFKIAIEDQEYQAANTPMAITELVLKKLS